MAKVYIDTELLLFATKSRENEEQFNALLSGHQPFLSDLVIAEVHNLEEQFRHWVGEFLEKNPMPVIKVNEESIEFARKYVYNKVIEMKDFAIGLHYAIASLKGIDIVFTPSDKWVELYEGFKRINEHFNVSAPEIRKVDVKEIPKSSLEEIRVKIARLLEAQGTTRLFKAIIESQELFFKEKGFRLTRIEKI